VRKCKRLLTAIGALPLFVNLSPCAEAPAIQKIVEKSVQANNRDFEAAPIYNYKELDQAAKGSKLYQVTMIYGTPYKRLLAVNGKPLSPQQKAEEDEKEKNARAQRKGESAEQRRDRIAKYESDRTHDHNMMNELSKAFTFTLIGKGKLRSFAVYVLKATPRPGYKPTNMDTQVLPGMQGKLWIDQKTYQWVKVTAEVIHPVSIKGFLAEVEPGTRFELEKTPVKDDVWLARHFSMSSHAKVLSLVNWSSSEDQRFFDYERADNTARPSTPGTAR